MTILGAIVLKTVCTEVMKVLRTAPTATVCVTIAELEDDVGFVRAAVTAAA